MADQYAIRDQNHIPGLLAHTGTAGTAETVRLVASNGGYLWTMGAFGIAAGLDAEVTHVNKFGKNPAVGTPGFQDIWDGSSAWVAPTTGRIHNIASSSTADTAAGTGARTMTVEGLDSSFLEQSETLTLNGTTGTVTSGTYTMIHRMVVNTAGNGNSNVGTITATAQTDSTVTAQIQPTNNQTLMAIYQVPANKTAYMTNYYSSLSAAAKAASLDVRIFAKPTGEVYQVKHVEGILTGASSSIQHTFDPYQQYPAKTIIKLQVSSDVASVDIAGGFDLIMTT